MKEFNGPWIHFILHFIRKKYNLDNILSSCSQLSRLPSATSSSSQEKSVRRNRHWSTLHPRHAGLRWIVIGILAPKVQIQLKFRCSENCAKFRCNFLTGCAPRIKPNLEPTSWSPVSRTLVICNLSIAASNCGIIFPYIAWLGEYEKYDATGENMKQITSTETIII